MNPSKVAIIAIGTEVVSGQISNTNAAWLSMALESKGFDVGMHFSVHDELNAIRNALDMACRDHQIVLTIGGLGPTTDDITREAVSEWIADPLEYQDAVWTDIQERAARLNFRLLENQKRQCYAPKSAKIHKNPDGAAPGLSFANAKSLRFLGILPGPPNELKAIWRASMADEMILNCPQTKKRQLHIFDCLNSTESQIAQLIEEISLPKGLDIGYRIHAPYVEVKVWAPEPASQDQNHGLSQIEQALLPYIQRPSAKALSLQCMEKISSKFSEVVVIDEVTEGELWIRMIEGLNSSQKGKHLKWTYLNHKHDAILSGSEQNSLHIAVQYLQIDESLPTKMSLCVTYQESQKSHRFEVILESFFTRKTHIQRLRKIFAEKILSELDKNISL